MDQARDADLPLRPLKKRGSRNLFALRMAFSAACTVKQLLNLRRATHRYGSAVAIVRKSQDGEEKNSLGPRLAQLRKETGFSQNQLAAALQRTGWDVSKATISAWEHQKRSLTDIEIEKILRVYRKSWRDL